MDEVRDVNELVGERVDRAGLCIVGPSAGCQLVIYARGPLAYVLHPSPAK